MTEKRILLVGDGNHQFITNYVHWLKKEKNNNFKIDILSQSTVKEKNKKNFNSIYRIKDENFIYHIISKIKGVHLLYRLILYKKLLKDLPEYDVIHFHYIRIDSYLLVNQFKRSQKSKIIFSIWGSDLYRLSPLNEKRFFRACNKADILTFANQKSINLFKEKYNWKNDNLKLCRFGLAPLERLKKIKLSKNECKQKLSWNNNKLAITIGYNSNPAQQHLEILKQFDTTNIKSLKEKIQLILPVTYNGTPKYKNQLLEKLKQLPFEYTIYDTFLTDDKVAQIRKASDVMIQLQLTDQFSGSMQEHLFARNVVITGSWLPYETMKEHGAWFIEIDKLEELPNIIFDVIGNYENYVKKTNNNPQAIAELGLWEKNIHDWIALYKD
ncbi:glycosyltransferase [Anaerophaga thermohalophila]|uniref:glycosyltransferase n=1 Tax=Anaerophaga thermohalophila TaxID=177400 RepID=UPI0002DF9969|nr:glycosyltransferase [Anaerophaga thermohalophila]